MSHTILEVYSTFGTSPVSIGDWYLLEGVISSLYTTSANCKINSKISLPTGSSRHKGQPLSRSLVGIDCLLKKKSTRLQLSWDAEFDLPGGNFITNLIAFVAMPHQTIE